MLMTIGDRNEMFVRNMIVTHIVNRHTGKERQVNYGKLRKDLNDMMLGWAPDRRFVDLHKFIFKSKDECRAFVNTCFEQTNYTLVSTSKGVFVASNHAEIVECAERLKRHALGELRRYSKLMRMPQTSQVVVDFDKDDLRLIDSYTWEHLMELDSALYEISKDRENDV